MKIGFIVEIIGFGLMFSGLIRNMSGSISSKKSWDYISTGAILVGLSLIIIILTI